MEILGVVDCFGKSAIRLAMTACGDLQNLTITIQSQFTQIQRRVLRLLC